VPATIVAIAATAFTVVSPPTWLGRLPQAVVDVATGERQELQQQLAAASAQSEQAAARLTASTAELTARDQTIGTQQQELSDLKSAVAARDAKLAEQGRPRRPRSRRRDRRPPPMFEAARKALLASEQTAQSAGRDDRRVATAAADGGARLSSLESEQRSQADQLANLTASGTACAGGVGAGWATDRDGSQRRDYARRA